MPNNHRHLGGRRRVAAALGAHDTVDNGHADAGKIPKPHAIENVLAGGMLRLVHDDEVRRASNLDDAAIQRAHPCGVAGSKAESNLGWDFAER